VTVAEMATAIAAEGATGVTPRKRHR